MAVDAIIGAGSYKVLKQVMCLLLCFYMSGVPKDIFICPEFRRTYIAIGSVCSLFSVCLFSVRTRMAIYAKVIDGFS